MIKIKKFLFCDLKFILAKKRIIKMNLSEKFIDNVLKQDDQYNYVLKKLLEVRDIDNTEKIYLKNKKKWVNFLITKSINFLIFEKDFIKDINKLFLNCEITDKKEKEKIIIYFLENIQFVNNTFFNIENIDKFYWLIRDLENKEKYIQIISEKYHPQFNIKQNSNFLYFLKYQNLKTYFNYEFIEFKFLLIGDFYLFKNFLELIINFKIQENKIENIFYKIISLEEEFFLKNKEILLLILFNFNIIDKKKYFEDSKKFINQFNFKGENIIEFLILKFFGFEEEIIKKDTYNKFKTISEFRIIFPLILPFVDKNFILIFDFLHNYFFLRKYILRFLMSFLDNDEIYNWIVLSLNQSPLDYCKEWENQVLENIKEYKMNKNEELLKKIKSLFRNENNE